MRRSCGEHVQFIDVVRHRKSSQGIGWEDNDRADERRTQRDDVAGLGTHWQAALQSRDLSSYPKFYWIPSEFGRHLSRKPIIDNATRSLCNSTTMEGVMPLQALDETLHYEERALRAEQNAKVAETLHLAALWRELATTYRELAEWGRTIRPKRTVATGEAIENEAV